MKKSSGRAGVGNGSSVDTTASRDFNTLKCHIWPHLPVTSACFEDQDWPPSSRALLNVSTCESGATPNISPISIIHGWNGKLT